MLMGLIAAVSSAGSSGGNGANYTTSGEDYEQYFGDPTVLDRFDAFLGMAAIAIVGLICILFLVAIVVWFFSTVARGGLIAGVNQIESSEESTFGTAWRAGWDRKWSLVGIRLILALPLLVMLLIGIGALFATGIGAGILGAATMFDGSFPALGGAAFGSAMLVFICLMCLMIPVMVFLSLLSEFAMRACMLEGIAVIESYRRGWHVLKGNLGPAIIIILIQFGIAILMIIPGFLFAMCCLLWPVLLVISAVVTAYLSTLWTLAWREWTGLPPADNGTVYSDVVTV